MLVLNLAYLKACPLSPDLMDRDWINLIFTINMNVTEESYRNYYQEEKEKKAKKVSDELMYELGYSDSDILLND